MIFNTWYDRNEESFKFNEQIISYWFFFSTRIIRKQRIESDFMVKI
jgi:hypothetical protein